MTTHVYKSSIVINLTRTIEFIDYKWLFATNYRLTENSGPSQFRKINQILSISDKALNN